MAAQLGMDLDEAHKKWVLQINELDEIRQDACHMPQFFKNIFILFEEQYVKFYSKL